MFKLTIVNALVLGLVLAFVNVASAQVDCSQPGIRCQIACMPPPPNCVLTGGRIEMRGCACCQTCIYTSDVGQPCGMISMSVERECGGDLICVNRMCAKAADDTGNDDGTTETTS